MNSIRLTFFLLAAYLLCAASQVIAQNEAIDFNLQTSEPGNTVTELAVPDPLDLQPNWWKYFEATNTELGARITQTLDRIQRAAKVIDSAQQPEANIYLKRIQVNLQALQNIKKAGAGQPPAQEPFKEKYTIYELLKLAQKQRELSAVYKNQKKILDDDKDSAKTLASETDTLTAAYRKLPTSSTEKLLAGLKIMAERLTLLISMQQVPIYTAELNNQQIKLTQLASEVEHAKNNIAVTAAELDDLDAKILAQNKNLDSAHQRLINAQVKSLQDTSDKLLSPVVSMLYKQQLVLAEIQKAQINVDIGVLNSLKTVVLVNLEQQLFPDNEIIERLRELEAFQKNISVKRKKWRSNSQKERDYTWELLFSEQNFEQQQAGTKQSLAELLNTVKNILSALSHLDSTLNDLSFLNSTASSKLAATQGPIVKFKSSSMALLQKLWEDITTLFSRSLFSIGDVPVTAANILQAFFILLISYFISKAVQRILIRISRSEEGKSPPAIYTLSRLLHYLIIIIGLVIALTLIGLNFTNVAIIAGALSVGIGFGLQSIVNNFVSGIIVLFEQNIKVGDFVELESGMKGVVKGIHVRSTIITTLDNLDIIVPNSELVTAKVTNYTMNEPMFRLHIAFGVAYGSDKKLVEKAGLEAARNVEVTYDDGAKRRPQVWLVGFGDSSLEFELVVWVVNKKLNHATPGSWKALYTWEIETALKKYAIEIPFPQRDLHFRSGMEKFS